MNLLFIFNLWFRIGNWNFWDSEIALLLKVQYYQGSVFQLTGAWKKGGDWIHDLKCLQVWKWWPTLPLILLSKGSRYLWKKSYPLTFPLTQVGAIVGCLLNEKETSGRAARPLPAILAECFRNVNKYRIAFLCRGEDNNVQGNSKLLRPVHGHF